jgi:hypothetical protein
MFPRYDSQLTDTPVGDLARSWALVDRNGQSWGEGLRIVHRMRIDQWAGCGFRYSTMHDSGRVFFCHDDNCS